MRGAATIGIVGGGQLGRMLTLAAKSLGFHVVVVDPNPDCPAWQVGAEQIIAAWDEKKALQDLARRADYLTIEVEHIDAGTLARAVADKKPLNPSAETIQLIQDKLRQKQFLHAAGLPVARFMPVNQSADAKKALARFKKMLLKTRHGGYDGRGNRLVNNQRQLSAALKDFAGRAIYAEEFVAFKKELAVIIARATDGKVALYPVVETVHQRSICVEVLAPAPISQLAAQRARALGQRVAKRLSGAGIFAIEMFLTGDDRVLINEIAPRVHNSGHYTIEACRTSQFEQHIRAISGHPLGNTQLIVPAAVMVNILGVSDGAANIQGVSAALKNPHTSLHFYGKPLSKIDRKMGHITATADTIELARKRARRARRVIGV